MQLQLLLPPSPLAEEAANISLISASHPRSLGSANPAMPCGNSLGYKFMIHGASGMQVMKHKERTENPNFVSERSQLSTQGRNIPEPHGTFRVWIFNLILRLLPREEKYPSSHNLQHSSPGYPSWKSSSLNHSLTAETLQLLFV